MNSEIITGMMHFTTCQCWHDVFFTNFITNISICRERIFVVFKLF